MADAPGIADSVRVVATTRVFCAASDDGHRLEPIIPLSFLDARWIANQPVQELLLYPDASLSPASLSAFKCSLARTLPFFHPLAGKLSYLPATGELAVDCSGDNSVLVVEAESDLDVHRLAAHDTPDLESFLQLVPRIAAAELPAPVLAAQITAFAGGGVAVGIAVHHAVVDARGFWWFVGAWAASCRRGGETLQWPANALPVHDRAVLRYAQKDMVARRFLQRLAPALPKLPPTSRAVLHAGRLLTRRTFTLPPSAIQALKRRASGDHSRRPASPPSTFEALAAHCWVSLAQAKNITADADPVFLAFLADVRSLLDPPPGDAYSGNCIRAVKIEVAGTELAGPGARTRACALVAHAVRTLRAAPLSGIEEWVEFLARLPVGRGVLFAGSTRLEGYKTDFGWGCPSRVELVSMNHDGEVSLFAGKLEGSVVATVGLAAHHMGSFADVFLEGLELDAGHDQCSKKTKATLPRL